MADPISLGLSAIGAGVSAMGSAQSSSAQASSYKYQAAVSAYNAQIAKQNANYAVLQGERTAEKYGLQAKQQMGNIVAGQAASGLDVRSGSNKATQESQQLISQMDQDTIRTDAAKTAYNYEVEAASATAQSQYYTQAASNTESAGTLGVISSLIGGASSVASKWMQGSQNRLWGN